MTSKRVTSPSRKACDYTHSQWKRKRAIMLHYLSSYNTNKDIAKALNISIGTVRNLKYRYKKQGLINEDLTLTSTGKKVCDTPYGGVDTVLHLEPNDVRLHSIKYKIKILAKPKSWNTLGTRQKYLNVKNVKTETISQGFYKTEKLIIDNVKVYLNKDYIVFSIPHIFAKNVYDAFEESVEILRDTAIQVQKLTRVKLIQRRNMDFEVVSNHYALIKNQLSKKYNKEKRKLYVYDDNGRLRLIVDNSLNLNEIECVDREYARTDMGDNVNPYFSDMLQRGHYKPSVAKQKIDNLEDATTQFTEGLTYFQENIQDYNKNVKLHMAVQNNQNKNLALMTNVLLDIKEALKKGNLGGHSK